MADPRPRLSRIQAALLNQMVEVAERLELGRTVPERLADVLAEYHFSARAFPALRELIRMGYLARRSDGSVTTYLVHPYTHNDISLGTTEADPLPHSESIRALCTAYRIQPDKVSVMSLSLGRPLGEKSDSFEADKPEPEEHLSPKRLGFLADLKYVLDATRQPASSPLSVRLIERHWPDVVDPISRRQTIQTSGWIEFDHRTLGWRCTSGAEAMLKQTNTVSTLTPGLIQKLQLNAPKSASSPLRT